MTITVYPVTETFAAEIGDIDVSKPLCTEDRAAIEDAFNRYSVLVFPDRRLSVDQHLDFARNFGPLETTIKAIRKDVKLRLPAEIADVSNLDHEAKRWTEQSRHRRFEAANKLWHTDSSFKRVPAKASLLYQRSIAPVGGHTEFADMRAAYDALDDATKQRLRGLVAEHSIKYSRAQLGFDEYSEDEDIALQPAPQVMVRRHPGSARMTLYLASHAGHIYGMPDDEAKPLIRRLIEHATQRQFIYSHRWRLHDLVMWDNRCTMHRVRPYDDLRWDRDAQRATVADTASTCEQERIIVPSASIAA